MTGGEQTNPPPPPVPCCHPATHPPTHPPTPPSLSPPSYSHWPTTAKHVACRHHPRIPHHHHSTHLPPITTFSTQYIHHPHNTLPYSRASSVHRTGPGSPPPCFPRYSTRIPLHRASHLPPPHPPPRLQIAHQSIDHPSHLCPQPSARTPQTMARAAPIRTRHRATPYPTSSTRPTNRRAPARASRPAQ